jgi:hypothetical protein
MFTATSTPPQPKDATGLVCFWCGEGGHTHTHCPMQFNIRFMNFEERQGFIQDELVALDVREAEE